jgi:hypothetical protein
MQYELFNLDGSSSKTWKELSAQSSRGKDGTTQPEPLYCSMSFVSWKEKVTIVRGEYSQRLLQARHTRENESLSSAGWPSPRASEYKDVGPVGSKSHDHMLKRHYLCAVVKQEEIDGPPAQENPSTSGKSQELWRTPQANEAGAKVETLFTKDGQPARPGERAYRKTPSGEFVLQSQTINQQVEMVEKGNMWATPRADKLGAENLETWAKRNKEGKVSQQPLPTQVQNWPTPDTVTGPHGERGISTNPNHQSYNSLAGQARRAQQNWPTLDTQNHRDGTKRRKEAKGNHAVSLHHKIAETNKSSMKLNPSWVEQLMGLPVGWTHIPTEWTV